MKMWKQLQKCATESRVRFICPGGSVPESETRMVSLRLLLSTYLCYINQGPELSRDMCAGMKQSHENPSWLACILAWFWKHGRKSVDYEFCAEDQSSCSHFPSCCFCCPRSEDQQDWVKPELPAGRRSRCWAAGLGTFQLRFPCSECQGLCRAPALTGFPVCGFEDAFLWGLVP